MTKLKVLYLVPQPTAAGQLTKYTFIDEEIAALGEAGVEPHVLHQASLPMPTVGRAAATVLPFVARTVASVPPANLFVPRCFSTFRVEQAATEMVRSHGIHIIHSHFGWPGGSGGLLTKAATGRPLVATFRGNDLCLNEAIHYGGRSKPFFDRAVRRLLRSADRTLYFSHWMRKQGEQLGAPASQCQVIPKGVDLERFNPTGDRSALKLALGLSTRPMLLTVAGLVPRKGIGTVLEAVQLLKPTHDFAYVVCGEGPLAAELREQVRQLDLVSNVTFTGRISRDVISRYFQACDMLIHAPMLEAAGNVLLEAMAAGRPIVCTDAGGPAEYVHNNTSGFVVPVGDVVALAGAVRRLLDDPMLADAFGQDGRRRAEEISDYGAMTRRIVDVYEDVLRSRA